VGWRSGQGRSPLPQLWLEIALRIIAASVAPLSQAGNERQVAREQQQSTGLLSPPGGQRRTGGVVKAG
jgi:hypothetical protein